MYEELKKKKPKPTADTPPAKPGKRETGRGVRHPHEGQTRSMPVTRVFELGGPFRAPNWMDGCRTR